jgi:hypothetical protein
MPPSRQCTDEIETTASGAAPGRSTAASTAPVQSWSVGLRTVSTVKPPARERDSHSSTGDE